MLSLTVVTATRPTASPVLAALYAGVATALAALATALLFQAENLVLWILAFLLIGIAPVIGYQLATGQLGSDWKPLIGGLLGFILLILGWILWPILVGAMTRGQSVGRLFLASLVGIILGIVVFLIAASAMGQNPSWISTGFILLWAVWGATVGAAMAAWGEPRLV
jgi:hypothetical protein